MSDLQREMALLASAEEFLDFFGIAHDEAVVRVNRLHILQRFHDYLAHAVPPDDDVAARAHFEGLLRRAYQDFTRSDARTEKVFKVFRQNEPQVTFVPLSRLEGRRS